MTQTRLQIEGGVVVNVAEVNPDHVPAFAEDWPVAPDGVGIGWTVDGDGFAAPATPAPVVPVEVTKLRFIRALRMTDFGEGTGWDAVKAYLAAASEAVREDWDAAQAIRRDDVLVLGAVTTLGAAASLSPEDMADLMDGIFILAEGL